ncbi:MAG: MATE family efflux transporter [Clostridia bacterium]|nr:MATE family efflux transporter [Clostridia bacterium]
MQDMTQGSISCHLLRYAIPMVLGNMLQLTYNAVDSMIIGKYLGEDALAAVSTANPIMTIMILGASGIGIGASVLMSKFYGAKDYARLKKEFSTTVLFSTVFSLIVFLVGLLLSERILRWIHVPEAAFSMALSYLRIIFVGFLFTFQYNILSSSMRAIGDSKTPVKFLGISCALNVTLDLALVVALGLGVRGAGLATAISEGVSVLCCVWYICRRVPQLQLRKGEWLVDRELLKDTAKTGALTALQQAAQPVGKVLIQSVINVQGVVAIGAFNAVCRVDDFACIPAQSMGSGIMTCAAQNRGAGSRERVKETLKKGLMIALLYFPFICAATLLLKRPVVALLTPDGSTEMIAMGAGYLSVKAWFFIMPCVNNAMQGFLRGLGRMKIVLIATVIQISIRTACVYLLVPQMGIVGEAYACMIGWLCMFFFETAYYFLAVRNRSVM